MRRGSLKHLEVIGEGTLPLAELIEEHLFLSKLIRPGGGLMVEVARDITGKI